MDTLIIIDDNENKYTYPLTNWNISIVSGKILELELDTPNGCFKYQIHTDSREPNINAIHNFISQKITDAINNIRPFVLTEYLVRDYIFIGDINIEERKQLTAQKL